jgi:hypothetical protein
MARLRTCWAGEVDVRVVRLGAEGADVAPAEGFVPGLLAGLEDGWGAGRGETAVSVRGVADLDDAGLAAQSPYLKPELGREVVE